MKIVELPQIIAVLDETEVMHRIEEAFRRFSAGEAENSPVGHLSFASPPGDCHFKAATLRGDDIFVVKISNSFYDNPRHGLSSSSGFNIVFSAKTGETLAILNDKGLLTDTRTAITGAIAAKAIARPSSKTLGVVGSGIQARLQAQHIARVLGLDTILIWARHEERAQSLAAEIRGESVSLETLCAQADIIVTTTPSTEVILHDALIRPGTRIVAVGADAPGKRELDPKTMARATMIVDSRAQCADHGDSSWAIRAGLITEESLTELGTLLTRPVVFPDDRIVIADMTGVAIQDLEISRSIWSRLNA
jgi:ornithine cyclodeaminase